MADELSSHLLPVKEENTQKSDSSHPSLSRKGPSSHKSQTYSKAGASVHSYSEIYESATRESIDETTDDLKRRLSGGGKKRTSKSQKSRHSVTWTTKYTPEQIDKSRMSRLGWDEYFNLEQLFSLKMINAVEYRLRKQQLVDSMTGTKVNIDVVNEINQRLDAQKNPPQSRVLGETEIIDKVVDFRDIPTENAVRHSCHIELVELKNKRGAFEPVLTWQQDDRVVKMANNPFTNGSLRLVYYMQDITEEKGKELLKSPSIRSSDDSNSLQIKNTATHVAKVSIDPMEDERTYFIDVAMQIEAQKFANEYNKYEVPKKVGFLDCWVYELVDREPRVYCGVERLIAGDYHKYTNNWDWVNQAVERNTPSAFSHYTYHASGGRRLVCDLQGVGDLYTDPQMHTVDGKGCGKGNMGKRGIEKFLSSHQCNAICTHLKLPPTNLGSQFTGTVPQKRLMDKEHVDQVPVTSGQYTVPEKDMDTQLGGTTRSTYKTTTANPYLTTYANAEYEEYDDSDEDGSAFPFGKRLPDVAVDSGRAPDHEEDKCWCNVL